MNEVLRDLELCSAAGQKAIEASIKEMPKRARGWISKEVRDVYNVKIGDLGPNKHMKVKATVERGTLELKYYDSEALAPVGRYGLKPASHRPNGYETTMQVVKGGGGQVGEYKKKKVRGGPHAKRSSNILMYGGGKVPAERIAPGHDGEVHVLRGPAAASLIVSPRVEDKVTTALSEKYFERLQHHLERAFK